MLMVEDLSVQAYERGEKTIEGLKACLYDSKYLNMCFDFLCVEKKQNL
jgi:hypothetical protein